MYDELSDYLVFTLTPIISSTQKLTWSGNTHPLFSASGNGAQIKHMVREGDSLISASAWSSSFVDFNAFTGTRFSVAGVGVGNSSVYYKNTTTLYRLKADGSVSSYAPSIFSPANVTDMYGHQGKVLVIVKNGNSQIGYILSDDVAFATTAAPLTGTPVSSSLGAPVDLPHDTAAHDNDAEYSANVLVVPNAPVFHYDAYTSYMDYAW